MVLTLWVLTVLILTALLGASKLSLSKPILLNPRIHPHMAMRMNELEELVEILRKRTRRIEHAKAEDRKTAWEAYDIILEIYKHLADSGLLKDKPEQEEVPQPMRFEPVNG